MSKRNNKNKFAIVTAIILAITTVILSGCNLFDSQTHGFVIKNRSNYIVYASLGKIEIPLKPSTDEKIDTSSEITFSKVKNTDGNDYPIYIVSSTLDTVFTCDKFINFTISSDRVFENHKAYDEIIITNK